MARLALLAALLVAFAPAVSRVLAGRGAVPAQLAELCTTAGLQWVDVAKVFAGRAAHGGENAPAAPHHGAGEGVCGYCALAASLSLPLLLHHTLAPAPVGASASWSPAPRLKSVANLRGLGGQGPPILL
jgi:hypothetical protein